MSLTSGVNFDRLRFDQLQKCLHMLLSLSSCDYSMQQVAPLWRDFWFSCFSCGEVSSRLVYPDIEEAVAKVEERGLAGIF